MALTPEEIDAIDIGGSAPNPTQLRGLSPDEIDAIPVEPVSRPRSIRPMSANDLGVPKIAPAPNDSRRLSIEAAEPQSVGTKTLNLLRDAASLIPFVPSSERQLFDDYSAAWSAIRGDAEKEKALEARFFDESGKLRNPHFLKNTSRGIDMLRGMGTGLGLLVTELIGGAPEKSFEERLAELQGQKVTKKNLTAFREFQKWLGDQHLEIQKELEKNPAAVGTYENLGLGVESGPGGALQRLRQLEAYIGEAVGENLPNMAVSMGGGKVGQVVAKKLVEKKLEGMAAEEAAKVLARRELVGQTAGAFAGSAGMEAGSIYGDMADSGNRGRVPAAIAALASGPAGALDAVGSVLALRRVGGEAGGNFAERIVKKAFGSDFADKFKGQIASGAIEQFVSEAPTEYAQTIIEQTAKIVADPKLSGKWEETFFSEPYKQERIDAFLKGGLAGVGTGVATGGAGRILRPGQVTPLQIGTDDFGRPITSDTGVQNADQIQSSVAQTRSPETKSVQAVNQGSAGAVQAPAVQVEAKGASPVAPVVEFKKRSPFEAGSFKPFADPFTEANTEAQSKMHPVEFRKLIQAAGSQATSAAYDLATTLTPEGRAKLDEYEAAHVAEENAFLEKIESEPDRNKQLAMLQEAGFWNDKKQYFNEAKRMYDAVQEARAGVPLQDVKDKYGLGNDGSLETAIKHSLPSKVSPPAAASPPAASPATPSSPVQGVTIPKGGEPDEAQRQKRQEVLKGAIAGVGFTIGSGTPNGVQAKVRYAVLPAELAKQFISLSVNASQTRQRSGNAQSDAQIAQIATNPDPSRLLDSPDAMSGAPTIDEGGATAGNGRLSGIVAGYDGGTEAMKNRYRPAVIEAARRLGIGDVSGIENPVLVRIVDNYTGERDAFVKEANAKHVILEESTAESAALDADAIGDMSAVKFTNSGSISAESLREIDTLLSKKQRGFTKDTKGVIDTGQAESRVLRAGLAKLARAAGMSIGDLTVLIETPEGKNLLADITAASPRLAKLNLDLSLADPLLKALREIQIGVTAVRGDEYKDVEQWYDHRQRELFTDTIGDEGEIILKKMVEVRTKRGIFRQLLEEYAKLAETEQGARDEASTGDIFGEQRKPITPKRLLQRTFGEAEAAPPSSKESRPLGGEPKAGLTDAEKSKKYQIKNGGPQIYTIVKELDRSSVEIENNEFPVEIKNEKTGETQVIDRSQLKEVAEKTAEEKQASKESKRDLDAELKALNVPAESYKGLNPAQKRDMIRRVKARNKPSIKKPEPKVEKPVEKPEPPKPEEKKLTPEEQDAKRLAELQAKLRKRLNTILGPDPELISIGAEMAGIYIKQGIRTFSAFAKKVKADLPDVWDKLKVHLRAIWEASAVQHPDIEEVSRSQADETIQGLDGTKVVKVETPAPVPEPKQAPIEPKAAKPIKIESQPKIPVVVGNDKDADFKMAISSANNHYTLWVAKKPQDTKGPWRWRYISILGGNKAEAHERAIASANRIAAGDLTGVAFSGKDLFAGITKISVLPDELGRDQLMGVDRISMGEQPLNFGRKHPNVKIKDLWATDPDYARWIINEASGKRAGQIRDYITNQPEYITAQNNEVIQAAEALDSDAIKLLASHGLTAESQPGGSILIGGKTYDWKETLKSFGARFDGNTTSWRLAPQGFKDFVAKLGSIERPANGRGVGLPLYLRDSGLGDIRKASEARPDRSGFEEPVSEHIGADTAGLLKQGLKVGMPAMVVDEQIEDVARINRGYKRGDKLFILASEPGSGKTFVLGGAIRELRRSGAKKIVYVTLRSELITQIKQDLKAYDIGDVQFITYPEMRKLKAEDSDALIFDEAHSIKNVKGEGDDVSQQAQKAKEWIGKAKMTILASATPYENPTQAAYLEPTGIFGETFGTFENFALAHGATKREIEVKTPYGKKQITELVWKRTTTSDIDSKAAREFFRKAGVFTSRKIRLAPNSFDSRLVKIQASQGIADMYAAFSQAAEEREEQMGTFAKMWVKNFQKRILESGKVEAGMKEAEAAMKRGRWPIIFVETKAERRIDIPDLIRREDEWARLSMVAMQNKDTPPPRSEFGLPPQGITEVLASFMSKTGINEIVIPSAEDIIKERFGDTEVAIFTGSVTPKKAQENLDRWRNSKKPILLVATLAKGGTGLSLHDKVGDHQTTQININLPWTATGVIQVAQRSARYGLKGQAEMQWIFAENIPFDRELAARVGGRMADMGSIVQGDKLAGADEIETWDFDGMPFSEVSGQTGKTPMPAPKTPFVPRDKLAGMLNNLTIEQQIQKVQADIAELEPLSKKYPGEYDALLKSFRESLARLQSEANKPPSDRPSAALNPLQQIAATYGWEIADGMLYNRNGVPIARIQKKDGRLRFVSPDFERLIGSIPANDLKAFDQVLKDKFYGAKLEKPAAPQIAPQTPSLPPLGKSPDEQLEALREEFGSAAVDDALDQYWSEMGQPIGGAKTRSPELSSTRIATTKRDIAKKLSADGKMPADKKEAEALVNKLAEEKLAKDGVVLTQEQADARQKEWIEQLRRIGKKRRPENGSKIVLSLFDRTGRWAEPWLLAGYDVRIIDLATDGVDVKDIDQTWLSDYDMTEVHFVLSANPCDDFAGSGARWWKGKDESGKTQYSVDLANHTLAIIEYLKPSGWALENPVGRLSTLVPGVGKPLLQFDPFNYGDPYTKRTQIFGNFNPNLPEAPVYPHEGSKIHKLRGDNPEQKLERSETPHGFAIAFALANIDAGPAQRVREIIEGGGRPELASEPKEPTAPEQGEFPFKEGDRVSLTGGDRFHDDVVGIIQNVHNNGEVLDVIRDGTDFPIRVSVSDYATIKQSPAKPTVPGLTPAQQKRLAQLVLLNRAAEEGGEPMSAADAKELADLRSVGQEELLKEPTGANEAAQHGEIARLRRKAQELDRQATLAHGRANQSAVSEVREKHRQDAYTLEKEAQAVRTQADEMEQALNPQARPNLLLSGEQATEEAPPTKPMETGDLFSASVPFYSRITRTVEFSQQGKATGAQWKALIRNSKLGTNADEFNLVGVQDLEDGKTYTKQEVLDYLKANEVVVKDVTLGEKKIEVSRELQYYMDNHPQEHGTPTRAQGWIALSNRLERRAKEYQRNSGRTGADTYFALAEEANRIAESLEVGQAESQTHFSQYQLPGAKEGSYREVLLTVPREDRYVIDTHMGEPGMNEPPFYVIRNLITGKQSEPFGTMGMARDFLDRMGKGTTQWNDGHSQYSGIANPIVRLRFNERTTADGKRMLFLEEVQAPQKGEFEKMPALFQKNWREIAFKWALRHAAENGFDSVGWTTGEQQAKRYDISKHVDSVVVKKSASDIGYDIQGRKNNAVVVGKAKVPREEISNYIGKDLAAKALADLDAFEKVEGGKEYEGQLYQGQDLQLGGEGLKKLYDTDFRNVVNNLPAVKKAGQKVGVESIRTPDLEEGRGTIVTTDDNLDDYDSFEISPDGDRAGVGKIEASRAQAEEAIANGEQVFGFPKPKSETIHSLTITPAIREAVMGGQNLFSANIPFPKKPRYEKGMTFEQVREVVEKTSGWIERVRQWVRVQPMNKPLVFSDGPDRIALVSPEPSEPGKWRTTRFVTTQDKTDNINRVPSGHMVFNSREEAVVDALTQDGFKEYEPNLLFSLPGWSVIDAVEEQRDSTYDDLLTNWQTANTVLDALQPENDFERELIAKLKSIGLETRVKLMPDSEAARRGIPSAKGVYNDRGNYAYVFEQSVNQRQTILHELTHAGTVKAMREDPKLMQELRELLMEARQQPGWANLYGNTSEYELVAEGYSSPEFRKFLDGFNTSSGESLWDRFVKWVRKALGLKVEYTTALKRLMELMDNRFEPTDGFPVQMNGQSMRLTRPGAGPVNLPAITAHHGTPHKVDKFTTAKIGTGEGAQVYGWGLYFAENPKVAEEYAKNVSAGVEDRMARRELKAQNGDVEKSIAELQAYHDRTIEASTRATIKKAIERVRLGLASGIKYTVTLNVEPGDLLDWDKPLSEQSQTIKDSDLVDEFIISGHDWHATGKQFYDWASTGGIRIVTAENKQPHHRIGQEVLDYSPKNGSERLASLGIKGIRYLDQGSRGGLKATKVGDSFWVHTGMSLNDGVLQEKFATKRQAEDYIKSRQTYNYVIFDENDITITHENGKEITPAEAFSGDLASMPDQPGLQSIGDSGVVNEAELQKEMEESLLEAEKDGVLPKDKTQRMGVMDTILGRAHLTPEVRARGAQYAQKYFNDLGIKVEEDEDGFFSPVGEDIEENGRRLLEALRKTVAQASPEDGYLGHLINSVRQHFAVHPGFSKTLRNGLYSVSQGEASHRGMLLAALKGLKNSVIQTARNVEAVLSKEYHVQFGGDFIDSVMNRIATSFRDYFTEDEIKSAIGDSAKLREFFEKAFALNRSQTGDRLYRRVQAYFTPKKAGKVGKMESSARLDEAFNEVIEQAKKLGLEQPVADAKTKLTPRETLALMAKPESAEKLNQAIAIAVEAAEREAGIKYALSKVKSEDRKELQEQFDTGKEPSEEEIEGGLSLLEFAHWKDIRDNLLGYSPVTLKLVQKLIQSDFKGVKFGESAIKPEDLRIDFNALAKTPEDEVRRVLEAYYRGIEATVSDATPEAKARILDLVTAQVSEQLDKAKARAREPMFKDLPKPGEGKTPEMRLSELVNAGLFLDPRLKSADQVAKVAAKSPFSRLVPNLNEMVKTVMQTPFYRQTELGQAFAKQMVKQLGLTPEQAEGASSVFNEAFEGRFTKARQRALEQSKASLTPKERRKQPKQKATWQKISEAVNAGVFDSGTVLADIAKDAKWMPITDEIAAKMRGWVERMEKMRELTQGERDSIGDDPAALAKAQQDKDWATLEKRVAIKKQIEAMWARLTHPITYKTTEGRANLAAAVNEFASANLLFKLSFPVRQMIDVLTQGGLHTPTRAIGVALQRANGNWSELWPEVSSALKDAYKARRQAYQAALQSARDAFAGTGEARNVDRLMSRIALFDRAAQVADEMEAKGEHAKAFLIRTFTIIRMGFRIAQGMDNIHGLPAEYQEMRQQIVSFLRENGQSRAEAFINADKVFGDMKAEYQLAIGRAQQILDGLHASGLASKPTANDVRASAWLMVRGRAYLRMKESGMPADDFQEENRLLRSTVGWNEREDGGLGGVIGRTMATGTQALQKAGVPMPLLRFGNAIATSINRTLTYTPLGFFPSAFEGSPWYKSEADKSQRKVEAAIGTGLGLSLMALAFAGALRVRNRWPKDKEERELWERQGHRPGTVEVNLGNGEFIPVSMSTGPFTLVRPWLAFAGALQDLGEERAKKQARLNAEAENLGVAAGQIEPLDWSDMLAVGASTAWGAVVGGRTASGLIGSITDYGLPNPRKFAAAIISPMLPTLPLAQELARMAGGRVDAKLAGIQDFLLPMPGSQAQQVNLLGDPVGDANGFNRVFQILTGGTGLPVGQRQESAAYATLLGTGYRPPSINPSKGYEFNGVYRPMTEKELVDYTKLRGQYLKEELGGMTGDASVKDARAAYARANQRALSDVGVAGRTTTSEYIPATVAAPASTRGLGIRRPSLGRRVRRPSMSRPRSLSMKLPRPRSLASLLRRGKRMRRPRSLR